MDHRQQDVHESAPGEHTVDQAEARPEQPAGPTQSAEHGVVSDGEEESEEEMEQIAERHDPER
jgi:hypothetical protein